MDKWAETPIFFNPEYNTETILNNTICNDLSYVVNT